jgi:hypothetical protein
VVREGEQGRRSIDKLAKVWTRGGAELWVPIPVEGRTTRDPEQALVRGPSPLDAPPSATYDTSL